jgi:GNAT superfamily N-acetyltransferase
MIKAFSIKVTPLFDDWNSYVLFMMDDPKNLLYGAFQNDKILGFANLKKKSEKLAWIEMVRVRKDIQKQGIGTKLFQFGVEEAKKLNYEIVGFATERGNIGSCKIGEKLGFKLLTEVFPYWVESDKAKILEIKESAEPISINEALNIIQKIPEGPKDYIAIGWDFAPLEKSFFDQEPDLKFYVKNNTILLEYLERNIITNEVDLIKAIVYGAEEEAEYLISDYVERRKGCAKFLVCITTSNLQYILKKMKFIPSKHTDGTQNTVLLWEKKL